MSSIGNIIGRKIVEGKLDQEAKKVIDYNQQFEYELRPAGITVKIGYSVSILLIVATIAAFIIMYMTDTLNSDAISGLAVLGLGGVFFLIMTLDNQKKYVKISNNFIESNSLFKKQQELKWDNIKGVIFKEKKIIEIIADEGRIQVFKGYVGSSFVLKIIHDKLELEKYVYSLVSNPYFLDLFMSNLHEKQQEEFVQKVNTLR